MKAGSTIRKPRREAGIALLIAIFVLLLISVVAIALIVSSGTESALAGNYRSATGVYYAALAGLEEGRGRVLAKNPNSFKNTDPAFLPASPAVGNAYYVINPAGAEVVAPWVPTSTYPDNEFGQEFATSGFPAPPNPSPSANSVSAVGGVQGPPYKWVRINAVSQQSLKIGLDKTSPVYYDGLKLNITSTGTQVLEITSFAVLPNGSQKLLQYLVAPAPVNLPLTFPAALIIAGNGVTYTPPSSNPSYYADGTDLTSVPFCTAGPAVHAVGVFDDADVTNVINGIPSGMRPRYQGVASPPPDVVNVIKSGLFPTNLQTPSQLDALAKTIIQNADVIITPSGGPPPPPVTGSTLTAATTGMSSTNPMTIVINGDLDLTAWRNTGYGLLLVTGNLNYDPDASWQGIVMVIGKGTVTGSGVALGEFDGTMFVAQTLNPATGFTTLLPDPNLGKASVIFGAAMGGQGFRYSSCGIQRAIPTAKYKILSFHEISQ